MQRLIKLQSKDVTERKKEIEFNALNVSKAGENVRNMNRYLKNFRAREIFIYGLLD